MKDISILLFDDSMTALLDIKRALRDIVPEENMHFATNYNSAIQVLSNTAIDLAIIDLMMPDPNGTDFIVYVRSHDQLREMPIIVVSSTIKDSILKKSYGHQVQAFLYKPVCKADLETSIHRLYAKNSE